MRLAIVTLQCSKEPNRRTNLRITENKSLKEKTESTKSFLSVVGTEQTSAVTLGCIRNNGMRGTELDMVGASFTSVAAHI